MADYAKLDNAMKNLLFALEKKAAEKSYPKSTYPHYKLGYLSSMMVGFLSQQSDETRQRFLDEVDEIVMNTVLVENLTKDVDILSQPNVLS